MAEAECWNYWCGIKHHQLCCLYYFILNSNQAVYCSTAVCVVAADCMQWIPWLPSLPDKTFIDCFVMEHIWWRTFTWMRVTSFQSIEPYSWSNIDRPTKFYFEAFEVGWNYLDDSPRECVVVIVNLLNHPSPIKYLLLLLINSHRFIVLILNLGFTEKF